MNLIDNLKLTYKNGSTVIKLIYVNVAIFLFVSILSVVFRLFNLTSIDYTTWFSVPSNPSQLLTHLWTPVTYMFYHEQFFHIFFNMLVLYWFGKIFTMYYSEKQLLSLYILGGLTGALVYVVAYNVFPYYEAASYYSVLMGASGSILAILVASAVRAPNMEMQLLLIGRIKLMWIAVITVLISFFGLTSENGGGEMAHLGGALAGILSAFLFRHSDPMPPRVKYSWEIEEEQAQQQAALERDMYERRTADDVPVLWTRDAGDEERGRVLPFRRPGE